MPASFDEIAVGSVWDRNQLAKLWGYRSFHAIARGVVTPAGSNKIILFVTEEKQESAIQYADRLRGGELQWEGEDGHGSDERIADAAENGDELHVFYRQRHHAPFVYLGIAEVISSQLLSDEPSKFLFRLRS